VNGYPMASVRQSQLVPGQHGSPGVTQGGAHVAGAEAHVAGAPTAIRSGPSCHKKPDLHPPANAGINKRISIQNLLIPRVSFFGSSLPSSIPHGLRQLCALSARMQLKSSGCAAVFATPVCRTRKTFCLAKM